MSDQQITSTNYFSALENAYYKRFEWFGKLRAGFHARDVTGASSLLKTNDEDVEIIGLATASLKYKAFDNIFANKKDLTPAIDATTKAGQAKISITNSTGATRWLADLAIRGKAIKRISGAQGFIHDSFKDRRSIRMNGRVPLEVGNNYIQSQNHVRKVADWLWKLNNSEKHIYTWGDPGSWMFYEPGEWYVLNIDAATETYNTTVKCLSVNSEVDARGIGYTIVEWGEVQQNWVFDSSYLAHFVIGGAFPQDSTVTAVVVAAEDYTGEDANYICDGTNDEAEINLAIQWVKGAYGGGYVLLTEGTFNIGAAIEMLSGVTLMGRGEGTVLDRNCNDYTIEAVGGDGTEKTGVGIQNMKLTFTDTNVQYGIWLSYSDQFNINNIKVIDPPSYSIYGTYCDSGCITNCVFDGNSEWKTASMACILFQYSNALVITQNELKNFRNNDALLKGIWITVDCDNSLVTENIIHDFYYVQNPVYGRGVGITVANNSNNQIMNNKIYNFYTYNEIGPMGPGIHVDTADYVSIRNNEIINVWGQGIYLESGNNIQVTGNLCLNNGQLIDHANCESTSAPHITGDGASTSNATFSRTVTLAGHTGTYCYTMTKNIAAGTGAYARMADNELTTDLHTLVVGKTYAFSGWIYVPSVGGPLPGESAVYLGYYNAAAWTTSFIYSTTTDTWEWLEATVTIPGTATGVRIGVHIANAASINEYIFVDDLRLYETGVANTHSMNFLDSGTGTNASGNSWQ